MSIYDNVVTLAKKKNLNIAQIEKKAGIANGTIGKWKDNENTPLVTTLQSVANVLGVSVNRLLKE